MEVYIALVLMIRLSQRVIPIHEFHKIKGKCYNVQWPYCLFAIPFKNSIIQEQNTKEIIAVKDSLYLIKTHVDFHKISASIFFGIYNIYIENSFANKVTRTRV